MGYWARGESPSSDHLFAPPEMSGLRRSQQGMALFLLLILGLTIGASLFLSTWNRSAPRLAQEKASQLSLLQAKQALIAYAVSVYPAGDVRPGDLPCPDTNNDGKKENTCGNASGSSGQAARLGRLPWRSLGLPDLRDGSGERLWYAVSNNFKENSRHLPLNSDTTGSIRVVDSGGNLIPDVIAVIFAPGPPLQRLNAGAVQNRTPAGENVAANYLDETSTEDNADFVDYGANGFADGIVRDAQGRILVNDTLLTITSADLIPLLEKKVAATVLKCLEDFAGFTLGTTNNQGRYPWPASVATSATGNYDDTPNTLFGRVPDIMCNTGSDGPGNPACGAIIGTNPNMSSSWGDISTCTLTDNWFRNNWREQVFYAIADAYKPGSTRPACGTCLTVGTTTNVRIAVMLGRQALSAPPLNQNHAAKAVISNYLEDGNATPYDGVFEAKAVTTTFNDLLVFK